MRTINANLTSGQKKPNITHIAEIQIEGTDRSSYLAAFTYREAAMTPSLSTVWLDNRTGYFTINPPARGDTIDLGRGATVSGTDYLAELPRLWVEKLTYQPGYLILTCIDFWGKLDRYQLAADGASWAATAPGTILDWILTQVSLVRSASGYFSGSNYIDYACGRGTKGATMLKAVLATCPEVAYHGLNTNVNFRTIPADQASAYTFGWNAQHPVLSCARTIAEQRYNRILVRGQIKSDGTRYNSTATDATAATRVGYRDRYIVDDALSSDAECQRRAEAELLYYQEISESLEIRCLPVHGLESFDVVTLDDPPWGGAGVTGRITSYTEYFHPDAHYQDINLSRIPAYRNQLHPIGDPIPDQPRFELTAPALGAFGADPGAGDITDPQLGIGNIPASVIQQYATAAIDAGALSATQTVGAAVYDTSLNTHISSAAQAETAYYTSAGRPAQIGDILLDNDTTDASYRVYVKVAAGTWAYYDHDATLT